MPAVHIIPVSDAREHWKTPECWCEPKVAWHTEPQKTVVAHRDEEERETGIPPDPDGLDGRPRRVLV